jgi:hypothetical protein
MKDVVLIEHFCFKRSAHFQHIPLHQQQQWTSATDKHIYNFATIEFLQECFECCYCLQRDTLSLWMFSESSNEYTYSAFIFKSWRVPFLCCISKWSVLIKLVSGVSVLTELRTA